MSQRYRTSLASRERNRIHARKTRQRKKEQMQNLQVRAEELKKEQLRLKQIINEKNTASILVGLFASSSSAPSSGSSVSKPTCGSGGEEAAHVEDPRVESLLGRSVEDIPDASKITELPASILPGHHGSKRGRGRSKQLAAEAPSLEASKQTGEDAASSPDDGIDYELLGKDRSKCTPEELDQIRRERNRMHAKRTRDRKRLFLEEMGEMCRQLEEENDLLRSHLRTIDPDFVDTQAVSMPSDSTTATTTTTSIAPALSQLSVLSPKIAPRVARPTTQPVSSNPSVAPTLAVSKKTVDMDQLATLLRAAGAFEATATMSSSSATTTAATQPMPQPPTLVASLFPSAPTNAVSLAGSECDASSSSSCSPTLEDDDERGKHLESSSSSDFPPNKRRRVVASPPPSMATTSPSSPTIVGV